jgi:hypothetical protein
MPHHKIENISPLKDYTLAVEFSDGTTRIYDVKALFEKWPIFKELKNHNLFSNVKIDIGGCGISWNDDIDISSEELFYNGKEQ